MVFHKSLLSALLASLLFSTHVAHAQDDVPDSTIAPRGEEKGFHVGLVVGTYFANKATASLYDGYGFDINGVRNNFLNSVMYNQIVNYYGGGNGGVDYIAQALNVNHNEWSFNESDMPVNMHYAVAFQVGLNMRYNLSKKRAVILNVNGTKLNVNGNFSISTSIINNGIQGVANIHPYTITGSEQRLTFQLGYQHIFGEDEDKLNFFVEGGFDLVLAKVSKNQAYINGQGGTITIDLLNAYNQAPYYYYRAKYFTGVGPGVFAGMGFNVDINPKYKLQLLYSPSYDVIRLGPVPAFKLQHAIGLRAYYNF